MMHKHTGMSIHASGGGSCVVVELVAFGVLLMVAVAVELVGLQLAAHVVFVGRGAAVVGGVVKHDCYANPFSIFSCTR